jgi:hypothetical protein
VNKAVSQGIYCTLVAEAVEFDYSTCLGNWKSQYMALGDHTDDEGIIRHVYQVAKYANKCAFLGLLAFLNLSLFILVLSIRMSSYLENAWAHARTHSCSGSSDSSNDTLQSLHILVIK